MATFQKWKILRIYVVSGFEYTIFLNKFRQIVFIKNTVN